MTTKVLFVTQDSAYPQMGVLYLVDALRQRGIESEIVPSSISEENLALVMDSYKPDVVGMSVMTSPHVADFARHSQTIKSKFPAVAIVWGGVHPTLLADACLECDYIDHVFVGQGEEVFPDLVEDIASGTRRFPRKVAGHGPRRLDAFRPAWEKVDVSRYLFSERHSVRSPDVKLKSILSDASHDIQRLLHDVDRGTSGTLERSGLLEEIRKWDVGLYDTHRSIFYYLLTSRGCPYKCTFCSEPLQVMHGDGDGRFLWNAHGLDWVKAQIETVRGLLAEHGRTLDGVGLWDDMFWVRYRTEPRALSILDYFARENLGYLIEARADQLLRDDGHLFATLGDTGCIQVFVGAESASQETLNYMRKGTRAADYFRLMEMAGQHRVALRLSFIIGFPNETDASVNETLDLCEAITRGDYGPWVNVSGPKIFTPYPGTVEYDRCLAAGFKPPADHVAWGQFHRSTEEYLVHFPWFRRNLTPRTLRRLERYFGVGYKALVSH